MKFAFIEQHASTWPVNVMCRMLGVSRSGYYDWRVRAPSATIAKEAGVSNGALFIYFATKADLLNQLYVELKADMALTMATGIPANATMRDQVLHVWNGWLRWTMAYPQARRALAHLGVSNAITETSHGASNDAFVDVEALLDRCRAKGALREAPLMFVAALVTGIVDATADYVTRDPAHGETHSAAGFEALWRVLS